MLRSTIPAIVLATVLASGHARFAPDGLVPPRSTSSGLKSGPCGGIAATTEASQRTILTAGEDVTLSWEETINHPGWFRIAFSPAGDSGFEANILKDNITDDQNGPVSYSDPTTYHKYSTSIVVPDGPCETCSLQLIQYMTENDPPTLYYSCADVQIIAADTESETKPAIPQNVEIKWQEQP